MRDANGSPVVSGASRRTAPNGTASNGTASNGTGSNGMASNGTGFNGTAPNGTAPNGTAASRSDYRVPHQPLADQSEYRLPREPDRSSGQHAADRVDQQAEYRVDQQAEYRVDQQSEYRVPGQPTHYGTGEQPEYGTGRPPQYGTGEQAQYRAGRPTQYGTGEQAQYRTGRPTQYGTGEQAHYRAGQPTQYGTGEQAHYRAGLHTEYRSAQEPDHRVPGQRGSATVPEQRGAATRTEERHRRTDSLRTTAVLPYISSESSKRTRPLRAWMLAMPVDALAMLTPILFSVQYWKGIGFTAVLTVAIFAAGGLYRGRRHMSILDEIPSLCGRMLASAAVVAVISAQRHDPTETVGFLRTVAFSAALVIVGRAITTTAVVIARRRRWVEHSAIIVGGGPIAMELARLLRRYPQYGLRFAGFVDVEASTHTVKELQPFIGHLDDIEQMIKVTDCDVILIADVDCPEEKLAEVVRRPGCMQCDLWLVPRLREFRSTTGVPDHIGAIPVVRARRATLSGPKWAMKRTCDIVFSVLALAVLSPILLLCALATRIEGGPGIFFRQQRVGRYGKQFDVLKFRSMRPSNEAESKTNWSVAGDPRIGPVGRFMRRTSLDELPQLWNILRGDMTIVGPRPERPFFVDQFSADHPDYAMRHRVPVGLTGLAQVSGLRGDTPISDRARFDNYYIENWSLWLDVKVVLRTVSEVFRGGGR